MKTAKTAAICGIMSLALAAAGLAGCGDTVDGTETALIINDEEINLGCASFYLRHQQAETENMMVSYGFGSSGSMWGTGTSSDDYGAQFKESTTDTFVEMVLQRQHAEEYGVSLTEEELQTITDTAQTFAVFRKGLLTPDGADEQAVQEITRRLNGEKWALHPDCRTCHNPCGRREDYFGGALETKRSPAIKAEIFRKAKALAGGPDAEAHAPLLYRAVFALGEDGDDRWLEEILVGLDGVFCAESV